MQVTVLPGKKCLAVVEYDDEGRPWTADFPLRDAAHLGRVHSLQAALQQEWAGNPYFTQYVVEPALEGAEAHRLRKRGAPNLLASLKKLGRRPVMRYLAIDLDNEGHAIWEPGGQAAFLAWVDADPARVELFDLALAFYFTAHGARLLYAMEELDLGLEEFEQRAAGFYGRLEAAGFRPDPACLDWTRIFKLPYVASTKGVEVGLVMSMGTRLALRECALGSRRGLAGAGRPAVAIRTDLPDFQTVTDLAAEAGFRKEARKWLKGKDVFDVFFRGVLLAAPGERHQKLCHYIGQAVKLRHVRGCTKEHIFGLFVRPVSEMDWTDSQVEDWHIETWSLINEFWEADTAAEEEARQAKHDLRERYRRGASKLAGYEISWPEVERRLIVFTRSEFFLLQDTGYYEGGFPRDQATLFCAIRDRDLSELISTTRISKDGSVSFRPLTDVLSVYGTQVSQQYGVACYPGTVFDPDQRAIYRVLYNRALFDPCYDPLVDQWLRIAFGSNYFNVCCWIAWALAFDEPSRHVCALSMRSPGGTGKGVFVEGLRECLEVPAAAGDQDVFEDFQSGLAKSPFVVIDEAFSDNREASLVRFGGKLRSWMTGRGIFCNRKYEEPFEILVPIRFVFTANNPNLIMSLGKTQMSKDDIEAFSPRVMHIELAQPAAPFLVQHYDDVREWFGSESKHILAKHFLWLHANRDQYMQQNRSSDRFIVEGFVSQMKWDLLVSNEPSLSVARACVMLAKDLSEYIDRPGAMIEDGQLYVTVSAVMNRLEASARTLGAHRVGVLLREQMCLDFGRKRDPRDLENRARYYNLNLQLLSELASNYGWEGKGCIMTLLQRQGLLTGEEED